MTEVTVDARAILADLARVKAAFQLRATLAHMGAPPPPPGALCVRIEAYPPTSGEHESKTT